MYGLNLNNQVFGFYQGSPLYMIQREYYQHTFAARVRWSPVREKQKKPLSAATVRFRV